MIDPNEFALAQSYESLAVHPAFLNLMQWLEEDLVLAETAAESIETTDSTAAWVKIIAWQQRKRVMTTIRRKIEEAKVYVQEVKETEQYERGIESDRASRAGWGT